jgi:hypothetical protein
MKPDDGKWTRHEIMQMLLAPRPKPKPKAAAVRAEERWSEKPTKVVIQDAETHNAAVLRRLEEEEREARRQEARRAQYQQMIDRVWQGNLDYQAELMQLGRPSFHRGPGDPDW